MDSDDRLRLPNLVLQAWHGGALLALAGVNAASGLYAIASTPFPAAGVCLLGIAAVEAAAGRYTTHRRVMCYGVAIADVAFIVGVGLLKWGPKSFRDGGVLALPGLEALLCAWIGASCSVL